MAKRILKIILDDAFEEEAALLGYHDSLPAERRVDWRRRAFIEGGCRFLRRVARPQGAGAPSGESGANGCGEPPRPKGGAIEGLEALLPAQQEGGGDEE